MTKKLMVSSCCLTSLLSDSNLALCVSTDDFHLFYIWSTKASKRVPKDAKVFKMKLFCHDQLEILIGY